METSSQHLLTIIYEGTKILAPFGGTPTITEHLARQLSFVEVTPTEADSIFRSIGARGHYRESIPSSYSLFGKEYPNSGRYTLDYFLRWEATLIAQKDYNEIDT